MGRASRIVLATTLLALAFGCAGRRETVTVPPRIDLKRHETIGIIDFRTSSKGGLGPLATRRFTEVARHDQGLVRMLEFGSESQALRSVSSSDMSTETIKALGNEFGVQTILTGELTVSDVKPEILISGLRSGSLSAKVDATLAVRLIETSTGASIWSSSARSTSSVGHVSVFKGGGFAFDADDPERAYGELIDSLVVQVTQDFRVRYERR